MPMQPSDFSEFFLSLHGHAPFPWQARLAAQVFERGWPDVIDLPTASGKTACLDIAVFLSAVLAESPRRIFFVVDRRVVVNEAFHRTKAVKTKLESAKEGILLAVADALRKKGGPECESPLEVYELRGGIYRDESWVRNPLQTAIVTSTVDQVGSRVLFRGYGVSDSARPIHAGLIAKDSLIFLDEAHCSRPFAQTLESIQRYSGIQWAAEPTGRSLQFIEMTATPVRKPETECTFQLNQADYENEFLRRRLTASKPTELIVSKNKPKDLKKLADTLAQQALLSARDPNAKRIAVMVNRIATARFVYEALAAAKGPEHVHLLIGRMRPVDRDQVAQQLEPIKSGKERREDDPQRFVVATQTLEVGADLDFDVLISECASIDSLLQRFGRLNRIGLYPSAHGSIVVGEGQIDPKQPDPVYGPSLAATWKWLEAQGAAGPLNFVIEPEGEARSLRARLAELPREERAMLSLDPKCAPVLLPAHLDALSQTSPTPAYEPSVDVFLHGPESGEPDVQVIWRADLDQASPQSWGEIVDLCPPVAAEAMSVPITAFRRWFSGAQANPTASELERNATPDAPEKQSSEANRRVLVVRSRETAPISGADNIRPSDTLILPASAGGWNELGHVPGIPERDWSIDKAEESQKIARRRLVVRLHPSLLQDLPGSPEKEELLKTLQVIKSGELDLDAKDFLQTLHASKEGLAHRGLSEILEAKRPRIELYPDRTGVVLSRLLQPESDDGQDETSNTEAVLLENHIKHVAHSVAASRTLIENNYQDFSQAADFHDHGKSDFRFQALLRGGNSQVARIAPALAKSGSLSISIAQRTQQRRQSGLPDGFRHELLSLLFLPEDATDLTRYLIASHHGYCRPFAPVVKDPEPPPAGFRGLNVSGEQRKQSPAHHLASGLSERFWSLNRRFGWWGLAYYEAVFRLADWNASASEMKMGGEL
ncbi:MAG: CRISPR-associated helicase Cas3, Anaes-subtype [Candidatus Sulfotelmatobacter sp.]|nr:CRISPR-associated helicase Cas3, Anaes-subtype [Candidatus Sulfotelmatobacter sp.]